MFLCNHYSDLHCRAFITCMLFPIAPSVKSHFNRCMETHALHTIASFPVCAPQEVQMLHVMSSSISRRIVLTGFQA